MLGRMRQRPAGMRQIWSPRLAKSHRTLLASTGTTNPPLSPTVSAFDDALRPETVHPSAAQSVREECDLRAILIFSL